MLKRPEDPLFGGFTIKLIFNSWSVCQHNSHINFLRARGCSHYKVKAVAHLTYVFERVVGCINILMGVIYSFLQKKLKKILNARGNFFVCEFLRKPNGAHYSCINTERVSCRRGSVLSMMLFWYARFSLS